MDSCLFGPSSKIFSYPLLPRWLLPSAICQRFDDIFSFVSFSPVSLSLEQVNHAADDPGQKEEAARDKEADVVLICPLKNPT